MSVSSQQKTATSTDHPLRIQLLGGFQLSWEQELVSAFSNTRLQRLLAYLILNQDIPQSRQALAQLFWPDSGDSQARTNLRNALHLLRTHLPLVKECIHSDNKSVTWTATAPAFVDVLAFDALYQEGINAADGDAAQNAYAKAIDHYKGELLPDCYEEWILPIREEWQQRYYQTLQLLAQRLEQQRKFPEAIDIAQKMLQIDPLQENNYALLMSLQAAHGDRAAALRTYHNCQTMLIDELGVEPGPATQSIYERLLNLDSEEVTTESLPRSAPLVGRDEAWAALQQAWKQAGQGQAALTLVSGEAGIGKSRLVDEWAMLLTRQGIPSATAHCFSAGGRLAFAPIQAWLRAPQIQAYLEQVPEHHQQELVRLLPELGQSIKPMDAMVTGAESMQRSRLFDAITYLFSQIQGPLLLILDDIQWCDRDTLEWLGHLFQHAPEQKVMLVATLRTEEMDSGHPVQALKYALSRKDQLTEIELARFDLAKTGQLIQTLTGKEPTDGELARIFADTEGNPLFVEEMVRSIAQAETYQQDGQQDGEAIQPSLPPKIQSVVEGRLVRLTPAARALADVAAVLGRVFTTGHLVAVTGQDEDSLLQGLDELWQQQIIREYGQGISLTDDAYDFAHDKLRDVVYQTLSPMRRRQLHRRAAKALEDQAQSGGSPFAVDSVSGQVASHYERGGQPLPAIQWYLRASEAANRLSASQEALLHLDHALDLLAGVPESGAEPKQLELAIQTGRAPLLLATKGYAAIEAEEALIRAWEICEEVGDVQQWFMVMWGLSRFYQVQPNFEKGLTIAEQMVDLAEDTENPALLLESYAALGTYHLHRGKFDSAIDYLDRSLAIYNPDEHSQHVYTFGQDPKVVALAYSAWTLFCMGRTEEAKERVSQALEWSETLQHPYSQVIARTYAAVQEQFMGNVDPCLEMAESSSILANEHGFRLWIAMSDFLRGWSMCRLAGEDADKVQNALEIMQGSAELYRDTGAKLGACYFAALLAEALVDTGQTDGGGFMIQLALLQFAETQERWCEAELHRIQGSILAQTDQPKEAQAAFDKALAVATEQGAGWWVERVTQHGSR